MSLQTSAQLVNATAIKFGHPHTLVAETDHWWVLLRPQQVTLGSLVLVCKQPVTAFGAVSVDGFADLAKVTAKTERTLKAFVDYQRINYLMLMMVDPDVHFHVIPRYSQTRTYAELSFADAGWPRPPDLGQATSPAPKVLAALAADLHQRWLAA